ncbi:hypothetical protein COU00_00300 [Candidatus Falkowbacteria bacterium CG10_big_fil_rev_8_21_14_0_10_43_11]|uniref:Polymerase nucleotidyl transferase domain-containing protein n=1 Tax=Candidatus Falkowbacteria bacterium CG10_big_fil_rev_8_21_14_0_10_43_11 TaxID=1974568 RepID=A0A2M6WN10_9BACT|nr:MAG: hypothetical protein COU00_00300 [Candidatus Falkowbacteria bacterium CG10_big_fil_rev_8_21_14_0_10_43_11]
MLSSTFTTLREVAFDFEHDILWLKPKRQLEQAVLQTLAYFDVFNFPLTDWEIYKYLWVDNLADKKISYFQAREVLAHLPAVECQDGFYFLAGQSALISLRKQRQIIAREKYQRARRVAVLFSVWPFIKMIAVCNSLAYDNARAESDIDFFIIAKTGKTWTVRFLTTLILKILRLRPTKKTKQDKICVNFIISEGALNLEPLLIAGDVYFKYWLKQLVPLYNQGDIFQKFIQANDFIGNSINSAVPALCRNQRKVEHGPLFKFIKIILEIISGGSWTENLGKKIQLKMMPLNLKMQADKGTAVVMTDDVLKFHEQDRRAEYRDLWRQVKSKK